MKLTVYCSSSDAVAAGYLTIAERLGREIGRRGHSLVYGGAQVGSMGAVARGAKQQQAEIIGVLPEKLDRLGLASPHCDEKIITSSMRERKGVMEELGEGFIALPGGIGTLEEILEIMVLKQLGYHARPVVFIDVEGFYKELDEFFLKLSREKFMKELTRTQYTICATPEEALDYIENYSAPAIEAKWFDPHR